MVGPGPEYCHRWNADRSSTGEVADQRQRWVFMKKYVVFAVLAIFLLPFEIGCMTQDKKVSPISTEMTLPKEESTRVKKLVLPKEPLLTVRATVEAVDSANRIVKLTDRTGRVVDLKVAEEVAKLPQVKVGDQVVAKYYEPSAVEIRLPGEPQGIIVTKEGAAAKPEGEPAWVARNRITVTGAVDTIDHAGTHFTIKGPDGRLLKIFLASPKCLKNVRVGDQLVVTYIEALAISMEIAGQK